MWRICIILSMPQRRWSPLRESVKCKYKHQQLTQLINPARSIMLNDLSKINLFREEQFQLFIISVNKIFITLRSLLELMENWWGSPLRSQSLQHSFHDHSQGALRQPPCNTVPPIFCIWEYLWRITTCSLANPVKEVQSWDDHNHNEIQIAVTERQKWYFSYSKMIMVISGKSYLS